MTRFQKLTALVVALGWLATWGAPGSAPDAPSYFVLSPGAPDATLFGPAPLAAA
jgi:hypothetical protein